MTKPTSIYHEISELVNDRELFDELYAEVKPLAVWPRAEAWLQFFTAHYSAFLLGYSQAVFAVLKLAKTNALFADQSNHEKELSFAFFRLIFKYSPHFQLSAKQDANYLLAIALIYGRYSGMAVQSPRKVLANLNHNVSKRHLKVVFKTLFVKYQEPHLFTNNLPQLHCKDVALLMFVLQGNNPRLYADLPIPLSKKESYFLTHAGEMPLDIKEKFCEKVIVVAKLLAVQNNMYLVSRFLQANHYFTYRFARFYAELPFWKSALQFLGKINWDCSRCQIGEFVDYFMFMKYTYNPQYSLKGRTQNSVTNAILEWHNYGHYQNFDGLLNAEWGKENKCFFMHNGQQYLFEEIRTGKRLFAESENMKHCAFSYLQNCQSGHTTIWSVQKIKSGTHKPFLTIEVRQKRLAQVVRKANGQSNKNDIDLVKAWAKEQKISF